MQTHNKDDPKTWVSRAWVFYQSNWNPGENWCVQFYLWKICIPVSIYCCCMIMFLGKIPLRQLVYRVHDLPPSMRPLVYDFGQLQHQREADYTHRIVHNYVRWGCRLLIGQHKLIYLNFILNSAESKASESETFSRSSVKYCEDPYLLPTVHEKERGMLFSIKVKLIGPATWT